MIHVKIKVSMVLFCAALSFFFVAKNIRNEIILLFTRIARVIMYENIRSYVTCPTV